jgi:putative FmdB family regulatory protein
MPIYEYHCDTCDHEFEHLAKSMSASGEAVQCPQCSSKKTGRKLSVFAVSGAKASAQKSSGHVHSGGCGCGRPHGSCGMNSN